jgi:hypothetical protein
MAGSCSRVVYYPIVAHYNQVVLGFVTLGCILAAMTFVVATKPWEHDSTGDPRRPRQVENYWPGG